jgi:hypothetical protein
MPSMLVTDDRPLGLVDPRTVIGLDDPRWIDAATVRDPEQWDPLPVVDGRFEVYPQPSSLDAHDPGPWTDGDSTPWVYGHSMKVIKLPSWADPHNIEVQVRWDCLPEGLPQINQVSPVVLADLGAADPRKLGVVPIWDAAFNPGATYIQNAFEAPLPHTGDSPGFYRAVLESPNLYGDDLPGGWPTYNASHWWRCRVQGGRITSWFNGDLQHEDIDLASATSSNDPEFGWAWALEEGRTQIGVHIIHFAILPGRVLPGTAFVSDGLWASRVGWFSWQPIGD